VKRFCRIPGGSVRRGTAIHGVLLFEAGVVAREPVTAARADGGNDPGGASDRQHRDDEIATAGAAHGRFTTCALADHRSNNRQPTRWQHVGVFL